MDRRGFLGGVAALTICTPAVARAAIIGDKGGHAIVDASYQSGTSLVVQPLQGTLALGDIITIDGVEAWSRYAGRRGPLGWPRQFVITTKAEVGQTVIHLYPPLDASSKYRTVVKLPMNRAEIGVVQPH